MKEGHELSLRLRREIDEEVTATDDVELGEGRVHNDILGGKDYCLPDFLGNLVAVLGLDEKPVQTLLRYVGGNIGRKRTLSGPVNGLPVQIGGKDLERRPLLQIAPGPALPGKQ